MLQVIHIGNPIPTREKRETASEGGKREPAADDPELPKSGDESTNTKQSRTMEDGNAPSMLHGNHGGHPISTPGGRETASEGGKRELAAAHLELPKSSDESTNTKQSVSK